MSLRPVAAPFVAAAPAGTRVRTGLRVSGRDEAVLRAAGRHLGSLAGRDLAARCAERRLDAKGRAVSRARRKQALTAESSSRWAGAITRTSEDQVRLAGQNLRAEASGLRTRIRRIEARLPVPAGGKAGRVRGYATGAERHAKMVRLQVLRARLAGVHRRMETELVRVVRGGKALLRKRGNLAAAGLTQAQWRAEWEAARLFLTADGEKDKAWGNETIRWNPGEGSLLEIRLPAPLAHLANRPHGRYRLSAPVGFSYRGGEVAAQAATGAIRYDISSDPVRGRWYVDASWKAAPAPAPCLAELRAHPVLAVDLNHGHLAVWAVTPDGNPAGPPVTVSLALSGFRDRLVQMAANAGLAVIAVDPAYTSRWGAEHWLGPLRERVSPVPASGHHAAAVVIGRRALGHRARRRAGVTGGGQRTSRRRAAPRAPAAPRATRDGRPRQAHRQPHPRRKTATARRTRPPDQAAQDRPGPPG